MSQPTENVPFDAGQYPPEGYYRGPEDAQQPVPRKKASVLTKKASENASRTVFATLHGVALAAVGGIITILLLTAANIQYMENAMERSLKDLGVLGELLRGGQYQTESMSVHSDVVAYLVMSTLLLLPLVIAVTVLAWQGGKHARKLSSVTLLALIIISIIAAVRWEPVFFGCVTALMMAGLLLEWVGPFAGYFGPVSLPDFSGMKNAVAQMKASKAQQNYQQPGYGNYQPGYQQGYQQPNGYQQGYYNGYHQGQGQWNGSGMPGYAGRPDGAAGYPTEQWSTVPPQPSAGTVPTVPSEGQEGVPPESGAGSAPASPQGNDN